MKAATRFDLQKTVFYASLLFLLLLAGVALGYVNRESIAYYLQRADTAIADLVSNPLTMEKVYDNPPGLMRYGDFIDDGYLLLSAYLMDEQRVGIKLVSLSDGSAVKSWYPDPHQIRELSDYPKFQTPNRFEPQSPLLLEDGGLVFIDNLGPLVRVDACAEVMWILDGGFHHSIERDLEGNFLVPVAADGFDTPPLQFTNNSVMRVSAAGKEIETLSVAQIMFDNDAEGLFHTVYPHVRDPIHLNDVEVARFSRGVWEIGDMLMSLRDLNTILIYRPDTKKIVWTGTGPWLKQHDPDYLEDGTIMVFGNDVVDLPGNQTFLRGHSDIYIIDPATNAVTKPFTSVMAREKVGTLTQGRSERLSNGDVFVEETDNGRLVRLNRNGLVWSYHNTDGTRSGLLNWSRYLSADDVRHADLSEECGAG